MKVELQLEPINNVGQAIEPMPDGLGAEVMQVTAHRELLTSGRHLSIFAARPEQLGWYGVKRRLM